MSNRVSYEINVAAGELDVRFTTKDVMFFGDPEMASQFVLSIMDHLDDSVEQVVLTLDGLNRVNSAMLGVFVDLSKRLHQQNIRFGIRGINPAIRKILELTRLTDMVLD
jgi:anti-anti-sigma factor